MNVGFSMVEVRDEPENNAAAGYPFDTMGISIDHSTDGLCIFTNLEHFSAGILKIGGSIPRDSIADPTDPEIIAEAIAFAKSPKSVD